MTALPAVGLCIGFIIGVLLFTQANISGELASVYAPYLSLAALAGVDTALGGIRAGLQGQFQDDIFASGFVLNTLTAAGLAYLGDKIGVDLFLAAVVALGGRVFLNISIIRRHILSRRTLRRAEAASSDAEQPAPG